MNRNRRTIISITLGVVGVSLLVGCFYVPRFGLRGGEVLQSIDKPGTRNPIELGRTTLVEVLANHRSPDFSSRDGRSIAYQNRDVRGYWFTLCSQTADEQLYLVRLNFDQHGLFRSYQTAEGDKIGNLTHDLNAPRSRRGPSLHPTSKGTR